MVLIQNEPYPKVLTNYQNSVMKDMNEGDIIVVAWPQPNGNIYPITHYGGQKCGIKNYKKLRK